MYRYRNMRAEDLPMVRNWRNAPQIKKYFFSQNKISAIEHEEWFYRNCNEPSHHLMVFEQDELPLGFLQLICYQQEAKNYEWGFYIAPTYLGQGHGKTLVKKALEFAFITLGAEKVKGKVLEGNSISEKIHKVLGFKQEGYLRNECVINQQLKNIFYYGLLKSEWANHQ